MNQTASGETTITYDDGITRAFALATVIWGVVGLGLGALVAAQLSFFQANFETSFLSFGRLRPLHTNAAIFAFVGNMMFAGIYYSTQRLLKARMASDALSWINFWGWQLIIVSAALTLPFGMSQAKEYAELIWPIDVAVAVVWVVFAVNFFWTCAKRNEKNLYVALWFYIATIVTIPVLYIVNNLQLPTSLTHSYPVFAGVQDALVQWWYGHNAVGFFLTTPILGIMYYYLPKIVGRPVFSYRLSIVHFWSLVFLYIWAGPHHLLYTSLPDWAQTLGMIFSLMLWAPSWGGMLNGLLTLRGAWDKLRTDPIVKFFIFGVTFYGMSTLEGPLLSIKSVNSLAHYTDWIIAHVHGGTLGWNGSMAAGMLYWLVPRLWNTKLYSVRLADWHFWIAGFGILLYVVSMWVSGVNQGLNWRALDADGFLRFPDFIIGIATTKWLYMMRLIGGLAFLGGFLMMAYNLFMTIRTGQKKDGEARVAIREKAPSVKIRDLIFSGPVVMSVVIVGIGCLLGLTDTASSPIPLTFAIVFVVAAYIMVKLYANREVRWHSLVEGRPMVFSALTLVSILIGGLVELVPTIATKSEKEPAEGEAGASFDPFAQLPYSPLELEGRDIYVKEGCYNCHSQMVRPFRHETLRYGEYSRAQEFVYDRPFQWGSKRTGPDLHRLGGRYPNVWHYQHFIDPRSTSPESIMPAYPWLAENKVDFDHTSAKLQAMQKLGVPYTDDEIRNARANALAQAQLIVDDLKEQAVTADAESEMVAIISYLQRLGKKRTPPTQTADADADKSSAEKEEGP